MDTPQGGFLKGDENTLTSAFYEEHTGTEVRILDQKLDFFEDFLKALIWILALKIRVMNESNLMDIWIFAPKLQIFLRSRQKIDNWLKIAKSIIFGAKSPIFDQKLDFDENFLKH